MGQKHFRPEQIIRLLRKADVLASEVQSVGAIVKALGVSDNTYYRWRKEYGGMDMAQAKRLKALEKENAQLKRAVADLTLDKLILKETLEGNS